MFSMAKAAFKPNTQQPLEITTIATRTTNFHNPSQNLLVLG
jgi:hypothetical protein